MDPVDMSCVASELRFVLGHLARHLRSEDGLAEGRERLASWLAEVTSAARHGARR